MPASAANHDALSAMESPVSGGIGWQEPFEDRQRRVHRFLDYAKHSSALQFDLKNAKSPGEICALSRLYGFPIELADLHLFYGQWDEPFWPWYGHSKQARRYFVHEGHLPVADR